MSAGWVYQGWVNAGYVDAGWVDAGSQAVTVTDPNEGWTAKSRSSLLIAESRSRVSIPVSRDRVWKTESR